MNKPQKWLNELNTAVSATQFKVADRAVSFEQGLDAIAREFKDAHARNASVWWVGNGGSAAICSHLSQDLMNKANIRSTVLSDAALISCMANDYGYSEVYRRPLAVMAQAGDLLVAISSSGRSENILRCAVLAGEKKLRLITVSAFDRDNPLWKHDADVSIYLPSRLYGHAEAGHLCLLHAVIETLCDEERMSRNST